MLIKSLIVALVLGSVSVVFSQHAEGEMFELVREDPPIHIYERWITFPGKVPAVKAREVKSEFLINTTMHEMLAILQNETKIKVWQKHVSEFKVYPQQDTSYWKEYSYHDIPWPVSDQDHFLRYDIEEVSARHIFLTFRSIIDPKTAPVRKSVSRMELAGSWRFEQISPTHVKVTYRILSMPSSIPRIFTDPVIRNNLMSTVKALTNLAEGKK